MKICATELRFDHLWRTRAWLRQPWAAAPPVAIQAARRTRAAPAASVSTGADGRYTGADADSLPRFYSPELPQAGIAVAARRTLPTLAPYAPTRAWRKPVPRTCARIPSPRRPAAAPPPPPLHPAAAAGRSAQLTAEEARHAARAQRLQVGDALELCDGRGRVVRCELTYTDKTSATVRGRGRGSGGGVRAPLLRAQAVAARAAAAAARGAAVRFEWTAASSIFYGKASCVEHASTQQTALPQQWRREQGIPRARLGAHACTPKQWASPGCWKRRLPSTSRG